MRNPVKALIAACLIVPAVGGGCSAASAKRAVDAYTIAMRYDVKLRWMGLDRESCLETSRRDFATIAQWGFETVAVEHLADEDRLAIVDLASEVGLTILDATNAAGKSPAVVTTRPMWNASAGEARGRLLASFSTQLREGRTGGLIVDRFSRIPANLPTSENPTGETLASHRAAITELLERAKRWGPLLAAADAWSLPDRESEPLRPQVTVLSRRTRRYVLISNTTETRFIRQEVALPGALLGATVARAVEVPASSESGAGRVFHHKQGRRELSVPVALRPGDAILLEIFPN